MQFLLFTYFAFKMSSGQILDKKTQTTDMSTRAVFMLGQPDTSSKIKGIKMK